MAFRGKLVISVAPLEVCFGKNACDSDLLNHELECPRCPVDLAMSNSDKFHQNTSMHSRHR